MNRELKAWLVCLSISAVGVMQLACATLGSAEAPPCDEATLAAIVASCKDEADCNRQIDERQATCSKRIKEDK